MSDQARILSKHFRPLKVDWIFKFHQKIRNQLPRRPPEYTISPEYLEFYYYFYHFTPSLINTSRSYSIRHFDKIFWHWNHIQRPPKPLHTIKENLPIQFSDICKFIHKKKKFYENWKLYETCFQLIDISIYGLKKYNTKRFQSISIYYTVFRTESPVFAPLTALKNV